MELTHTKYSIKGGFCVLVCLLSWASQVAQWERIRLPMQKIQVRSLGQKDPLEKEMATHFSILAWKLPWTGEPGRLQTTGMQSWTRLGQRRSTAQQHQLLTENLALENKSRVATTRSECYVFGFLLFVLYLYYISYVS